MSNPEFDLTITGGGLYTIRAKTERALLWLNESLDCNEDGVARCDDTTIVTEIAEGAIEEGFEVGINGRQYIGGNTVAA